MKIKLTQNKYAIIDRDDADFLRQFVWNYDGRYASTYINGRRIRMHRLLLKPESNEQVDHINMDSLDNRRSNIRKANKSQNMANRGAQKNSPCGYKGVHQRKDTKRWQSYITVRGKRLHLGYFDTAEQAARRYNETAIELFGEFARVNIW